MTEFGRLLETLALREVRFLVVGGVAATLHGSARLTRDLDVVYSRHPANLERLAVELEGFEFRCLGLDELIEVKRAAGRPKDLETIAELEIIRDELG